MLEREHVNDLTSPSPLGRGEGVRGQPRKLDSFTPRFRNRGVATAVSLAVGSSVLRTHTQNPTDKSRAVATVLPKRHEGSQRSLIPLFGKEGSPKGGVVATGDLHPSRAKYTGAP
jgi:hypothetical protein